MTTNPVIHYDVIIVGAGPAGTSCALALKDSNLNILLLDKESFPRDKICGDAITGRSIKTLNKLAPELVDEIRNFGKQQFTSTTRIFIDNNKPFNINWVNESYCIKRYDFDALLLKHAIKNNTLTFETNFKVDDIIKQGDKVLVGNKKTNAYYSANIVVAADGSQSYLAKQLIDLTMDPSNFSAAVRAYYSNVAGMLPNQTEIHIYKKHMPGYFWIFPLSNNAANVGFGMLSTEIAKRNINLKQSLTQIISQQPQLINRFHNAKPESDIKGFGLALGSRRVQLYGNNFLLVGDAASLIDPKSGEGISAAIESGMISAQTIIDAHRIANFSKETLKQYKTDLDKRLKKELLTSTIILRLVTYFPSFFRITMPILMRSKWLIKMAGRL